MASIWELFVRVSGDNSNYKKSIQESTTLTERFGQTFSALDARLGAAIGFGAIGAGALAAANKFDQAYAQIARSTGASGEKLGALEKSFANVYKQTAASSEQVANTLSILSTRTQATGKDLEALTLKTIKLAKTQNEDVGAIVPLVTRAFGDWSIATAMQGKAMDYLRVVSQQTGTQVGRLTEQVVYAGAPLRQLGYNFEQAVALIGKFEKEGVNTELVLGGMKAALQKFAKEGVKDTAAEWQKFVEGVRNGSITFQQVAEEVGAKRAVDLYKAIQEGRFEIDKMVDSSKRLAKEGGDSIETYKSKFTKLQHAIETFFSDHKDVIIGVSFAWPLASAIGKSLFGLLRSAFSAAGVTFAGGAIVLPITIAGIAGWFAGDAMQKKFAPGGNTTPFNPGQWSVVGHDVVPTSQARMGVGGSIIDFVNGLSGGKPAPAPAPHVLDDKEIKTLFSALEALNSASSANGLKNLKDDLAKGLDAFRQLAAAGLLTHDQMLKAAGAIRKVRDELDGVKTPLDLVKITTAGPSLDDLRALPLVVSEDDIKNLAAYDRNLQLVNDTLAASVNAAALAQRNVDAVADAFHNLGLSTPGELQQIADAAESDYKLVRESGVASADAIGQAWAKMFRAQLDAQLATGKITRAEYDDLVRQTDATFGRMGQSGQRMTRTLGQEFEQMTRRMFDNLERGIAHSIVEWKGWGETFKSLAKSVAEDTLQILLKGLFAPLEKKLAGILGSIGGGASTAAGGASSAAGAASGAGGAAGAIGGSALGWANLGVSVFSAVSGVLQGAAMNKSLDVLVNHTLRSFNELAQFRQDAWTREGHLMLKLDDMWNEIRNVVSAVKSGGAGGGKGGINFTNCSFNGTPQQNAAAIFQYAELAGAI